MCPNAIAEMKPAANGTLRLFTLYVDFNAGVVAKRLVSQIVDLAGNEWSSTLEMQSLSSVIHPRRVVREFIGQEAGEADVLIVACNSLDQPEPAVACWLDSLAPWQANRETPGLLIGLLGETRDQAVVSDSLLRQLLNFGARTQMDFFWCSAEDVPVNRIHLVNGTLALSIGKFLLRKKLSRQQSLALVSEQTICA